MYQQYLCFTIMTVTHCHSLSFTVALTLSLSLTHSLRAGLVCSANVSSAIFLSIYSDLTSLWTTSKILKSCKSSESRFEFGKV